MLASPFAAMAAALEGQEQGSSGAAAGSAGTSRQPGRSSEESYLSRLMGTEGPPAGEAGKLVRGWGASLKGHALSWAAARCGAGPGRPQALVLVTHAPCVFCLLPLLQKLTGHWTPRSTATCPVSEGRQNRTCTRPSALTHCCSAGAQLLAGSSQSPSPCPQPFLPPLQSRWLCWRRTAPWLRPPAHAARPTRAPPAPPPAARCAATRSMRRAAWPRAPARGRWSRWRKAGTPNCPCSLIGRSRPTVRGPASRRMRA